MGVPAQLKRVHESNTVEAGDILAFCIWHDYKPHVEDDKQWWYGTVMNVVGHSVTVLWDGWNQQVGRYKSTVDIRNWPYFRLYT